MNRKSICTLLLLLCLLLPSSIGMAAEITDQELTRLEQIFQQLEINNNEQQQKLERASNLLTQSETQILLLNEKLRTAELSINQAQNSLQKANESLQAYEREMRKERSRLKFERNLLLIGISVLALKG